MIIIMFPKSLIPFDQKGRFNTPSLFLLKQTLNPHIKVTCHLKRVTSSTLKDVGMTSQDSTKEKTIPVCRCMETKDCILQESLETYLFLPGECTEVFFPTTITVRKITQPLFYNFSFFPSFIPPKRRRRGRRVSENLSKPFKSDSERDHELYESTSQV